MTLSDDVSNDPLIDGVVRQSVDRWSRPLDSERLSESLDGYRRYTWRKWVFMAACLTLTVLVSGYSLTIGGYSIGFLETFQIVWGHIVGDVADPLKDHIVINLRLPRIVTAILAGVGLAVCGVAMQSSLLNPLADPYTTGVSSGALFGATLGMILHISLLGSGGIVLNAFVFALIPMVAIMLVSKVRNSSPTTMIMAGIAVMYIFNALTALIKLSADPNDLKALYEWSVGTLYFSTWSDIPMLLGFVIGGMAVIQFLSRKLNVLASGEENAKGLGVNTGLIRRLTLLVVSLTTAAVVSVTGLIGFVGLVAPHITRIFIGSDNRFLVPASAIFGAFLLIIADMVGRLIVAPAVLEVGVVTSFLGGPLFLWLILRSNKKVWD